MKTLIVISLVFTFVACSNSTSSNTGGSTNTTTAYYVTPKGELSANAIDTLVVVDGVLDSEYYSGAKGTHEKLQLVSTLQASQQVYLPGWTPFAFKVPSGDALTFSWSPTKDTIGLGDYYIYQTAGYSNGGLIKFVKQ